MAISQFVDVTISRQTTALTQAGFGTALVVGSSGKLSSKVQTFQSIEAVEAVFSSGDPELEAARRLFGQDLKPERIKIAQRDSDQAQVNNVSIDTVANNETYTVTINGTAFNFTSDATATASEISAGLVSAINGGSEPVTATDNSGDLDIAADVAGDPFTISVSATGSGEISETETTPNRNISTELAAIEAIDADWYALISASRTAKDIERAADFIESREKIYIAASDDSDIFTTATTDIATTLKNKSLDRTAIIAIKGGVTEFPDAAWAGLQLPKTPGSSTWAFKTLSGITVDDLTDTEISNAGGKNANLYIPVLGVNITSGSTPKNGGIMASGEFIDVIRGIDKVTARIRERIFSRFVNLDKIPFTDAGVSIIEDQVRAELRQGVLDGIFAADPEPSVDAPLVADVSSLDKANRNLPDVTFEATLAGAIHKVAVQGTVTV